MIAIIIIAITIVGIRPFQLSHINMQINIVRIANAIVRRIFQDVIIYHRVPSP